MRSPISRPGPVRAVSRPPSIPSTSTATREHSVMISEALAHESRLARPASAKRAIGPVPCAAGRYGATRRPGPDGAPVLLAGQVATHGAHRLSLRRGDGARGGHAGARHRHDLGCGHPDLGGQPDRRGARCGHPYLAADAGDAVRDPALYRPRHLATRLPASEGRSGSASVNQRGHLDPRNLRTAPAPFLLDQRVEGTGRAGWPAAGHRVDPAGLVLQRGARSGPGADHRSGLLPPHRRYRALAVPSGAQARRQAGGRLAVRFSPPVPQVGEHGTLLGLRPRPACVGCSSVAAGVSVGHRSASPFDRTAGLQARAADGTGISCGQAVNPLVLSGATGHVLSGASPSCYQAHERLCRPRLARLPASLNLTNLKALTCYWASAHLWTGVDLGCLAGEIRP